MPFKDYEYGLEHRRNYQQTESGKAAHLKANRLYRQRNKHKLRAHNAVARAVKSGELVPWPVCALAECNDKPQAHHPDYNRPLDVVWLCQKHHTETHNIPY